MEDLHLLADALVVARGEEDLDAVQEAVAGQGDAEGLPRSVMGIFQRFGQRPAVIAEPLLNDADDLGDIIGGVADHLPQTEADQLSDERHEAAPLHVMKETPMTVRERGSERKAAGRQGIPAQSPMRWMERVGNPIGRRNQWPDGGRGTAQGRR